MSHLFRFLAGPCLALALFLAPAAQADSLYVGTTYSGTIRMVVDGATVAEGGGNIGGSTGEIGGIPLAFIAMYCVDQFTGASLGATYPALYNLEGIIGGKTLEAAGQIAWLMLNIAPTLTTQAEYQAMQGLIWQLLGPQSGHSVAFATAAGTNSATAIGHFNDYVAALGGKTAPVSSVWWINPQNSQNQYGYQGFVAITASQPYDAQVPEPATLALFGSALAGLAWVRRRRR